MRKLLVILNAMAQTNSHWKFPASPTATSTLS